MGEHVVEIVKRKLLQIYDVNIDDENEKMIVCDMETDDPRTVFAVDNEEFMQADVVFNINRLNDAIDHYQVGHMEKLDRLRNELSAEYGGKVSVAGSGYDGVGIPDCILSAHKTVENIANALT